MFDRGFPCEPAVIVRARPGYRTWNRTSMTRTLVRPVVPRLELISFSVAIPRNSRPRRSAPVKMRFCFPQTGIKSLSMTSSSECSASPSCVRSRRPVAPLAQILRIGTARGANMRQKPPNQAPPSGAVQSEYPQGNFGQLISINARHSENLSDAFVEWGRGRPHSVSGL